MSTYAGIENAPSSGERLPNINPGLYLFEIEAVKSIKSRKSGDLTVVEFRVIEASGPNANTVGTSASWIVKMSLDNALGNVRSFLAAAMDVPEKSITQAVADDAVGTKQPLKGFLVKAEASIIKTKAGTDFTLVRYRSVPEQSKLKKTK